MKRVMLVALLLAASFVFTSAIFAQNGHAPLVQQETISITHVNLNNVDADKLSSTIQKIGNAAVDYFVEDSEQATEAKNSLPLFALIGAQYFTTNVQPLKDAGADDFYFVVDQPEDAGETFYPYLAFPVADLTGDQKKELRDAIRDLNQQIPEGSPFSLKYRFERHGFLFVLIIPESVSIDEVKAYMKDRFTEIATVEKEEFVDGFERIDPTAVISGVTLNAQNDEITENQLEEIFDQLDSNLSLEEEYSDSLKEVIVEFNEIGKSLAEKVLYNYWYISLDNLEMVSNIQAKSANDAEAYVADVNEVLMPKLYETLDGIFEMGLEAADADLDEEEQELTEKVKELLKVKEQLKTVLGTFVQFSVDDSVITWKMDEEFWTDNKPVFDEMIRFFTEEIANQFDEDDVETDEEVDDDFETL